MNALAQTDVTPQQSENKAGEILQPVRIVQSKSSAE